MKLSSARIFLAAKPESGVGELDTWELDAPSKARIAGLKEIFVRKPLSQLASFLELLASVLFLIRTRQASSEEPKQIERILKANDKPFDEKEVVTALQFLRQHGFAV